MMQSIKNSIFKKVPGIGKRFFSQKAIERTAKIVSVNKLPCIPQLPIDMSELTVTFSVIKTELHKVFLNLHKLFIFN